MNHLRVFLSITLFIISAYFLIDIVIYSFDWLLLLLSIIGFCTAHYIWPAKHNDEQTWYDIFEIVIELPFRAIAMFFRGIGKFFKNSDSSFDI